MNANMDVVLRLLGLSLIVIGLREGVEGFEVLDVCGHELGVQVVGQQRFWLRSLGYELVVGCRGGEWSVLCRCADVELRSQSGSVRWKRRARGGASLPKTVLIGRVEMAQPKPNLL